VKVVDTKLAEVKLIDLAVFEDARGHFYERFHEGKFAQLGLPTRFAQDNVSVSRAGVLRGLHFQTERPQGKLVQCTRGRVWDVAVDVRPGSSTFRQWVGVTLSAQQKQLFWIPPGFAHGFCVLEADAELHYKCTELYDASSDTGIRWDDPELAIAWPVASPVLSAKDRDLPLLSSARLPRIAW
jgi:dTDP-4-dehydrorhamnose 3,5-epimerase